MDFILLSFEKHVTDKKKKKKQRNVGHTSHYSDYKQKNFCQIVKCFYTTSLNLFFSYFYWKNKEFAFKFHKRHILIL